MAFIEDSEGVRVEGGQMMKVYDILCIIVYAYVYVYTCRYKNMYL
jgi:hypothetical protein